MVRVISRTPDRDEVRTISPLAPRGTHSCAPPTIFARPAHKLLVRLLGRIPSFVHSPPWIPPMHSSLPFPPGAGGMTGVGEGAAYTFFKGARVVRLGPGPDPEILEDHR